eukprot:CAMPEP_0183359298 /NCGR_PEP_ID=MMETSP0164_2-20130417/51778_1 /TAXON_ID=221442 /ORGANISM="Coccolithus pelagicus ssp braarudi, Strain PLY182g" /LENGTH=57 /DNA_ID=CAMNT_0025533371 /DNA_START=89 /DNA_END=259 /DNA_ORIENTATION=+
MGGGNANKSMMKRLKNMKKAGKNKKTNPKEAQKKQKFNICQFCRQSFPMTAKVPELK